MGPILSIVLLTAAVAPGETGWTATFRVEALSSWMNASTSPIWVIAGTKPARAPARALVEALSRTVGAHVEDRTLVVAPSPDDSDQQLIRRAAAPPYQRIVIARMDGTRAVIVGYQPNGKEFVTLAAEEGVPVAPRPSAQDPGWARYSQDVYDTHYVWFGDERVVQYGEPNQITRTFVGRQAMEVVGEDSYLAVGRSDLADRYLTTNAWRMGLVWGGFAAAIGSAVFVVVATPCARFEGDRCVERERNVTYYAGMGASAASVLVVLIAWIWNPHPLSGEEFKVLAKEYNEDMRKHLSLPQARRRHPPLPALRLAASLDGVSLVGTF